MLELIYLFPIAYILQVFKHEWPMTNEQTQRPHTRMYIWSLCQTKEHKCAVTNQFEMIIQFAKAENIAKRFEKQLNYFESPFYITAKHG